jgi:hypothetical protein
MYLGNPDNPYSTKGVTMKMNTMKNSLQAMLLLAIACGLVACKPSGPPPDIIKTQRQDLEKAKAVSAEQLKAAEEQRKAIDDATGK